MAAVERATTGLASPAFAESVARRGTQVVAKVRRVARMDAGDKRRVPRVGLVPVVATFDNVGRRPAPPVAAAVSHEQLAALVVIKPPLVAASMCEDFERFPRRVIAPYTGV